MTGVPASPRPPVTIVGLDLSLTSTGIAKIYAREPDDPDGGTLVQRLAPGRRTGHERLEWIVSDIRIWCSGASLAVIEGPSFGSSGGLQHDRGGLWWLVAHSLWDHDVPYVVVPPATLKRYATGKGNAQKDHVLAAVIRRYPDIEITGNDTADALVLAAMAADHYDLGALPLPPATHRAALAAVRDWPDIT